MDKPCGLTDAYSPMTSRVADTGSGDDLAPFTWQSQPGWAALLRCHKLLLSALFVWWAACRAAAYVVARLLRNHQLLHYSELVATQQGYLDLSAADSEATRSYCSGGSISMSSDNGGGSSSSL